MNYSSFCEYSTEHVHFLDDAIPDLLKTALSLSFAQTNHPRMVDLGCGDGRMLFGLLRRNNRLEKCEIIAIDISPERIKRIIKTFPFIRGLVASALNVKELVDSSCDIVICSQLIEHVNDKKLLFEIKRVLKKNAVAYISSVVKRRYAVYLYFGNGSFKLDPTHIREYSSVKDFAKLMRDEGFDVIEVRSEKVMYPVTDFLVRFLIRLGLTEPNSKFFYERSLNKIRKLKIPIIGYCTVDVLVRKK